jgi:multidrug efflux pump subunit AcrA (membrane-fusion protein)
MKNSLIYGWLILVLLYSCGKEIKSEKKDNSTPTVTEGGKKIVFPDPKTGAFFETEKINIGEMVTEITAPAKVSATVIKSDEGAAQNIILFENPDLAGNYSQIIEHLTNINQIQNINIKQKKIELERAKDLQIHGAATGKDLLEAQTALSMQETNLANEKAAIIEHETKLKAGGFQPELMRKAPAGTAYIICDIPENQMGKIKKGTNCIIQFLSFPNENFTGKIDDVADMLDQTTRMVKLRVTIDNNNGRLKAGMFATVSFGINEGNNLSVDKNSMITMQGKNFVFVKTNQNTFERREVKPGVQVADRIIIYEGIASGESIAIKGVMQLKGLSFGY